MARVCEVTGKKPLRGNHVSHANNKTLPPLSAEPAVAPLLGREREPLGPPAREPGRPAPIDKKGIDVVLAELRASGVKI